MWVNEVRVYITHSMDDALTVSHPRDTAAHAETASTTREGLAMVLEFQIEFCSVLELPCQI